MTRKRLLCFGIIAALLGCCVAIGVTWTFFFEIFYIPSSSMQPTLLPGDLVWVDKSRAVENLQKGDVIVFYKNGSIYIKRIIAKEFDRVRSGDHQIFVNEEPLLQGIYHKVKKRVHHTSCVAELNAEVPEVEQGLLPQLPYVAGYKNFSYAVEQSGGKLYWIAQSPKSKLGEAQTWVVPEKSFFVMGDNRDNSLDSRTQGFVPYEDVLGVATSIWLSTTSKAYACGEQPLGWLDLFLRRSRGGMSL